MGDDSEMVTISARIPPALARRLDRAATGAYAPTKTQIIVAALVAELSRLESEKAKDKKP